LKITLMLTESCSHHEEARALIDDALSEVGVEAEIDVITVRTDEEAHDAGVIGSPTIRVDGVDIEHGDREPPETSPNCRFYNSPAGWKPVPDKGMLLRAIERARG
jgi:hypothetical protein